MAEQETQPPKPTAAPTYNFIENFFCKKPITDAANNLSLYNGVLSQLDTADKALQVCQANYNSCMSNLNSDQQSLQTQISTLNETVATLTSQLATAQQEAAVTTTTLFTKPMSPILLIPSDPLQVMLGEFYIRNTGNDFWATYPSHAAVFWPSPLYEYYLNLAGCNKKRTDLTTPEICIKIANACQQNTSYMTNSTQWGAPVADGTDWMPGPTAQFTGHGDCKILAQNICSAILYYEQKFGCFTDYSVTNGLGHLIEGTNQYGHAFVVLANLTTTDSTQSYIIEATLTFEADPLPFSEATTSYWIDWGVLGYATLTYPEGAYQIIPSMHWWTSASHAVCSCNFCNDRNGTTKGEPVPEELSEEEKKTNRLKEIWEPRRRKK